MRAFSSDTYPLPDELRAPFLEAVGTRLSTDISLLTLLGGSNIFVGADPANKPASGKWITVGYEKPNGPVSESMEGWLRPRLWIKSETRQSDYTFSEALSWHSEVHAEIFSRIKNYRPSLSGGLNGGTGAVYQREEMSQDVTIDADDETYLFASFYSTRIIAAHAA